MSRNEDEINKLTHTIIGCAMTVHNTLGNGFQEVSARKEITFTLR